MPKLSIIVPIYNVEPYLYRCIDSILSQTYRDYEAILIDDGSPDRCGEIIDEYAKIDDRIVSIHQVNKGVSAARNAGLSIARGEYIGFVDPDDWIEPNMYDILINNMEREQCDIASCSWIYNDIKGNEQTHRSSLKSKVMTREEYMLHLFDMPPTISGSICSKLFKRKLIGTDFDRKYKICEDNLFLARYCTRIQRALYTNKPLYHVFDRDDSATRKIPGEVAYGLPARQEIIEVAKSVSEDCGMLAERLFLDQCVFFVEIDTIGFEVYNAYARKILRKYVQDNLFGILKNHTIPYKEKVLYLIKAI